VQSVAIALMAITGIEAQEYPFEVEITGNGQPVLLFPGFTCTKEVWQETVAELSKTYECHAFTFAGFGNVAPIATPWLPKIKEGMERYIQDKQLQKSIIIGHSLGGTLGLWLASSPMNQIEKLIVVDGLPASGALMFPNYKSDDFFYDSPYNKQVLEMSDDDFVAMANQFAMGMTQNADKRETIKNWILQADRETYVYGYTDLLKLDLRNTISAIQAQVLVLGASLPFGKETVIGNYNKQFEKLPSYELRIAENAAHFIMYDSPEWLGRQINEFLN